MGADEAIWPDARPAGRLRQGHSGRVAPDQRRKVHASRYTITVVRQRSHDAPPLSRRTVRRTLSTNRSTVSCGMPVCCAMQGAHRAAPLARAITIRPQSSASLLADTNAVLSRKQRTRSRPMVLSCEILPSASRLALSGEPPMPICWAAARNLWAERFLEQSLRLFGCGRARKGIHRRSRLEPHQSGFSQRNRGERAGPACLERAGPLTSVSQGRQPPNCRPAAPRMRNDRP